MVRVNVSKIKILFYTKYNNNKPFSILEYTLSKRLVKIVRETSDCKHVNDRNNTSIKYKLALNALNTGRVHLTRHLKSLLQSF